MCGIVGYVGDQDALPILMRGLKRLEYRGYDSAGIALVAASSGQMNSLGQHVAEALAAAIQARIAQEFKLQNQQSSLNAQMPGGHGRFAYGGGRAPW